VDLGVVRRDLGEDPAKTQRLVAQLRTRPVRAPGCRVAFVEDEVDDFEHRGQPFGAFRRRRQLERDLVLAERPLGPHDALRDRGLGLEERTRDLPGRQPAEQPQGERHPRLGGQHRVAGDEHQPQQIVAAERGVVQSGLDLDARLHGP
jgi:hypothetical protein